MKCLHTIVATLILSFVVPVAIPHADALSCLPIDMYLKDVIGKEEVVIFEATSLDRIEEVEHTIEVLQVTKAEQGWVEDKLFAYHEKHPDWGYLCNSGPTARGTAGLYVASRNEQNQYFIHQRLELTDPLTTSLKADLSTAKVEGGVSEVTKTDRQNQIRTSMEDLLKRMGALLREFIYWTKN